MAPVAMIDDDVYGRLTPDKIPDILANTVKLLRMHDLSLHVFDIIQN